MKKLSFLLVNKCWFFFKHIPVIRSWFHRKNHELSLSAGFQTTKTNIKEQNKKLKYFDYSDFEPSYPMEEKDREPWMSKAEELIEEIKETDDEEKTLPIKIESVQTNSYNALMNEIEDETIVERPATEDFDSDQKTKVVEILNELKHESEEM